MAFELKKVVPWGRTLEEYRLMFDLREDDLRKRIVSVGDGPASFNAEMNRLGYRVQSLDPIYAFSTDALEERIGEVRGEVMAQMRQNQANFVWSTIRSLDELERIRMGAMQTFLADFADGKAQGRYVYHSLPERTPFDDGAFELGLSSHFLILYAGLGLDFHLQAIRELLRICREVRIFPVLDLNAKPSPVLPGILDHFQANYQLTLELVGYEFQRGGNTMMRITPK